MSDNLVKRLRTETNGELGRLDAGSRWGVMIVEAADRIEELEKKLLAAFQIVSEIEDKVEDFWRDNNNG